MSRIRSIHPSLCTDEIYMGLSITAKAAWPLLWMECDDGGAFEWKPVVLKARLFPADAIDMSAILEELHTAGAIARTDIGGKPVGLIRNFCKYQRPKKPIYRFAVPDEFRTFVALSDPSTEPVPHQFPTSTELPAQMEEEGGRMNKESKSADAPAKPKIKDRKRATQFPEDLKPNRESQKAAGLSEAEGGREFIKFRNHAQSLGRTAVDWPAAERNWYLKAAEFMGRKPSSKVPDGPVIPNEFAVKLYRETGRWNVAYGPEPDKPGCRAPPEFLAKYGFSSGEAA